MRLRGDRSVVIGAIVIGAVLGTAAPAQAHNYLVSSTPAADSTLTELPDSFEIVTNDNLLDVGDGAGGFALQVRDSDGRYYGDGCVTIAGPAMSATPALGAPGVYTVLWQVVSADGHTVSDEYTFTWAPTGAAQEAVGSSSPPTCGRADAATTDDPGAAAPASDDTATDVLWIGGTILALAIAVVVTLLLVGRRRKS